MYISFSGGNGGRWINLAQITNVTVCPVQSSGDLPDLKVHFADRQSLPLEGSAGEQLVQELEDMCERFAQITKPNPADDEVRLVQLLMSLRNSMVSLNCVAETLPNISNLQKKGMAEIIIKLNHKMKAELEQVCEVLGIELIEPTETTHLVVEIDSDTEA